MHILSSNTLFLYLLGIQILGLKNFKTVGSFNEQDIDKITNKNYQKNRNTPHDGEKGTPPSKL